MNEIEGFIYGAVGGAVLSLVGYWKQSIGGGEPFDYKKMLMTTFAGAVVGAGTIPSGLYTEPLAIAGGSAGIAYVIENIIKGGVKEAKSIMGK